jgi:hypothetical protein
MNNGNVNVVILLDLKKAFDVVDHDIMAKKLEIYGFNKKALALFNSYMKNRTPIIQFYSSLPGLWFVYLKYFPQKCVL